MVDSVHSSWTAGGSVHHGPHGGADWRPPEYGSLALAFCRGRREVATQGRPQWPAMKALVTRSEEGGRFTTE
jgi:hypothetical protein